MAVVTARKLYYSGSAFWSVGNSNSAAGWAPLLSGSFTKSELFLFYLTLVYTSFVWLFYLKLVTVNYSNHNTRILGFRVVVLPRVVLRPESLPNISRYWGIVTAWIASYSGPGLRCVRGEIFRRTQQYLMTLTTKRSLAVASLQFSPCDRRHLSSLASPLFPQY